MASELVVAFFLPAFSLVGGVFLTVLAIIMLSGSQGHTHR